MENSMDPPRDILDSSSDLHLPVFRIPASRIKDFLTQNPGILDVTFFTAEAWFHLSGYINSQNTRIWAAENPHSVHEEPLHSQEFVVWCGVSCRRIIGPIFLTNSYHGSLPAHTQRVCQSFNG